MRSYFHEILDNPGFDIRPLPPPKKKPHLDLKSSYHIASLFYMYIDMGGKQYRPSLIIAGLPPGPPK